MVIGRVTPTGNKTDCISAYLHAGVVFHEILKQMSNSIEKEEKVTLTYV
jgi:hypothetical protein